MGIVLAAGEGSRWDGPGHKLLAPLSDGRPVIVHAVEAAVESGIGPVAVVWGAVSVADALAGLNITLVEHPGWAAGQATTLAAAISWASGRGARSVVVGLGDQPGATAAAWRAVAHAEASPPIAAASYDGVLRTPVRLPASVWADLSAVGDQGARVLMRSQPDLVQGVAVTGVPDDIDTMEELRRWN